MDAPTSPSHRSNKTHHHSQKHLDALLGAARLEVFLPQVDILAAGEMVNELCIVVGGVVEVVPIQMDGCEDGILGAEVRGVVPIDKTGTDMPSGVDGAGAVVQEDDARPVRLVGEGELFGEVAFFTETAQVRGLHSETKSVTSCVGVGCVLLQRPCCGNCPHILTHPWQTFSAHTNSRIQPPTTVGSYSVPHSHKGTYHHPCRI